MKKTALIMAGGRGERFWPKSRKHLPKQFLCLSDDGKTMIQLTVERISSLVDPEDVFICTNRQYRDLAIQQLPQIPPENILCEPIGRNTAPCVGLGAEHIRKKYGDALIITLPSDHLIKNVDVFVDVLKDACNVAQNGENLVTIGITPSYPEVGYGYVKFIADDKFGGDSQAHKVDRFVEKPDLETAKEYLATKQYLWNSGMFVWKSSTILSKIESFLPNINDRLNTIYESIGTADYEDTLSSEFEAMDSVSVDYGVLEKTKDIYIIPGEFGWDDVGSWLAVGRVKKSNDDDNVISGNVVTINTKNSIIEGGNRLVAVVGVDNLIVVETDDAVLICNKDNAGDIKKVVETLKNSGSDKYI